MYGNNPNKSKWYPYRNTNCLNERNASCRSVQNLPSYSLLSENSKTKKRRNIIFGVVIHCRQIWYLTRREKYRLRLCENSVLRNRLAPGRNEVTEEWRRLHNK